MSPPRKLIYIMGCAHCGSTLLTRVLARHSQIATVGELKMSAIPDYRNYQCGCGAELLDCAFWKRVVHACAENGVALDLGDFGTHYGKKRSFADRVVGAQLRGHGFESLRKAVLSYYPPAARALAKINQRNEIVIDKICEVLDKPVFLDDSKDPTRLLHFCGSGHYDIRAIHMIRDGRAIIASHKKRNPDMNANIELWENKVRECDRLKKVLPNLKLLEVRYEDFCQDPSRILPEILAFAGLDAQSERCLESSRHEPQHIIGHNSRLQSDRSIVLRTEWQALLTAQDLERFELRGRELNALYGYNQQGVSTVS